MKNTKNIQSFLFIALFLASAYCQFAGYNTVTVQGNDDPNACLLTLTYAVTANKVKFTETVYNPFQSCTYQNLTFVSQFYGYQASGSVDLVKNPANASQYIGELTLAKLTANNGTGCFNAQPHFNSVNDIYVCRFTYGWNKHIDFFLEVNATTLAFVPNTGSFFPLMGATKLVAQNGTTVWKTGNTSYADIVGQLYKECGGWSTQIPSGNNKFLVTGTILASQQVNLQTIFSNVQLFSVIVRKSGQPSQYMTNYILNFSFAGAPNGNCSDTGLNYNQIVANNMNYCKNGCEVSIYMQGYFATGLSVYTMRTSGFTYAPPLLRA